MRLKQLYCGVFVGLLGDNLAQLNVEVSLVALTLLLSILILLHLLELFEHVGQRIDPTVAHDKLLHFWPYIFLNSLFGHRQFDLLFLKRLET